jgi:hypothetical protein
MTQDADLHRAPDVAVGGLSVWLGSAAARSPEEQAQRHKTRHDMIDAAEAKRYKAARSRYRQQRFVTLFSTWFGTGTLLFIVYTLIWGH